MLEHAGRLAVEAGDNHTRLEHVAKAMEWMAAPSPPVYFCRCGNRFNWREHLSHIRTCAAMVGVAVVAGCSSVSYVQQPDGTVRVQRNDLGRDVVGENLEVDSVGFRYATAEQNESISWKSTVNALERSVIAGILAGVSKNTSDNNAKVDSERIAAESSTDKAAIAGETAERALKEETEQIKIIETTDP
jgi:outer membrane murein-binding lipoprotein Lpp